MRAALPAARAVMDRMDRIALSARDTKRVLDLLETPPKPTKRLLDAVRRKRRA
jgi:uncharacterized protein (DUF1778 family)